mgnify:CR=1 FL=1
MNNLSKEKKQKLFLVVIIVSVVLAGLWFGLVKTQQDRRALIQKQADEAAKKVADAEAKRKKREEINQRLEEKQAAILAREATMPFIGDPYPWILSVMNQYTLARPNLNFTTQPPSPASDVVLLPKFPYKAVFYRVSMSGFFEDFGRFLAELENEWPFARVQNVQIVPSATGDEKLDFQFELTSLVSTNRPSAINK